MAKKKKPQASARATAKPEQSEGNGTLKDLLQPDVIQQLKKQSEQWKLEEDKRKEETRQQQEAVRRAEQKKLESNFEHLLNESKLDWRKYKQ